MGVSRCLDDIAPEIPSGGTHPTLPGGVLECADIQMRLLQRFCPGELVPHSLEVYGSVQMSGRDCSEIPSGGTHPTLPGGVWECLDIQMRLLRRFHPGELIPHSLGVSGSVQTSGRDCSRDSIRGNSSHTPWRCLGVCRCLDDIAPEIPSRGTHPTLPG